MERLSIILPCFNEEGNIERTVREVMAWMHERGIRGEIIVVNDGSRDATGEILEKIKNSKLKIITHPANLGYGAAVRAGCNAARTEWIGFMDSDGQFDPRDFDRLLPFVCRSFETIRCVTLRDPERSEGSSRSATSESPRMTHESFDVVVGRRRRRADPLLRKVNAKLFGMLSWMVLGIWVRDVNCAMKVFRRSAWEKARPVVTTGALLNAEFFYNLKRAGIRWHQVDVAHYPRRAGKQTGANLRVILQVLRELWVLRSKMQNRT